MHSHILWTGVMVVTRSSQNKILGNLKYRTLDWGGGGRGE